MRLAFPGAGLDANLQAQPKEKQLLQNQPHLGRAAEPVQLGEGGVRGREMNLPESPLAIREMAPQPEVHGQRIVEIGRHLPERVVHQPPKPLRRQGADTLVHGHHAGAVQSRPGLLLPAALPFVQYLVLRVDQPQPPRVSPLRRSVELDPLARRERGLQIRLVHPHGPKRARIVPRQHLEQREAPAAGMPQTRADHPAADRGGFSRPQIAGTDEAAAILVAERKPVEKIVAGTQPGPLELRRTTGTDPLQETQRGPEVRTGGRSSLPTHHGRSHPAFTAR